MKATKFMRRGFMFVVCLALLLSFVPRQAATAASPDVVISQVYGGGGNSGGIYTNDFIELFNRGATSVSLSGWSVQYASNTGTGNFGANTGQITPLSGTLAPGQYMLVQEAAGTTCGGFPCGIALPAPDVTDSTPINMSGTGGKVALVTSATTLGCNGGSNPCSAAQLALIKDLIGWDGADFYEMLPAPATSNSTADIRKNNSCTDYDNNAADFAAAAPSPRNKTSPFTDCTGPLNPVAYGLATPNVLEAGNNVSLTVSIYPGLNPPSTGLAVTCDLTPIGGVAAQAFYDDGSNGDAVANDNTFTFATAVGSSLSPGPISLPCSISDSQSRSDNTAIGLNIISLMTIGAVNGPVLDGDNGPSHKSPQEGNTVTIRGVIYEKTLQATSGASTNKGFFIQNTVATADGDSQTSDGLFVYMGTSTGISGPNGQYTPKVGDEIILTGKVQEYFNMTELANPLTVNSIVRSDVDLTTELQTAVANPSANLDDANRYWERLQGMRVQAPADSIVLNGRNVFSPADAEIWVARSDSTIALREDPYTRRAFRDAHPLDDNYDPLNWDGNGYRILLGSLGIKYVANDAQALIAPAHTFDTVTNAPIGGLNYTFSKYRIEITEQPVLSEGVDPATNAPPTAIADRSLEYNLVDYNLENLYDFRDNPFSGCDFKGNPGCFMAGTPFLSDVGSPFDYVSASNAAYQARLADIATQIINDLHSPDILMVQEVENQDICTVSGGTLVCGISDNADGKPDVLQDLALKIASLGGPAYDSAFDHNSSDLRGILPAFLYRTDRVQLLPPGSDPVLAASPAIGSYAPVPYDSDISNPKTLNAVLPDGIPPCETSWVFPRAPSVALFRIYNTNIGDSLYQDVYTINNHFKSGPDSCVGHRTEQARYNAALVAFIQAHVPGARIVVGGDLNVYPRPDDPFAPIGQVGSSDQLGSLYDPALGLTNLWDVLLGQAPASAYGYVYVGMAQTLDQIVVNEPMLAALQQFRVAHINSDFPADYPGDVARGTSDHDPDVATFHTLFAWNGFSMPVSNPPSLNKSQSGSVIPVKFSLGGNYGMDIIYSGYPTVQPVDCTTLAASGTHVSAVIIDSSYDPLVDQYIFNWKTDSAWKGSCQMLTVQLIDGSMHVAYFKFK